MEFPAPSARPGFAAIVLRLPAPAPVKLEREFSWTSLTFVFEDCAMAAQHNAKLANAVTANGTNLWGPFMYNAPHFRARSHSHRDSFHAQN